MDVHVAKPWRNDSACQIANLCIGLQPFANSRDLAIPDFNVESGLVAILRRIDDMGVASPFSR